MQRGIFITFEGSEGCGKSTQILRLCEYLKGKGQKVTLVREPGSTPISEQIRHILKYSEHSKAMTPEAELLLFAASRAQLVREALLPLREKGEIVLADRFMDSTTVYQGAARKIDPSIVKAINAFAVGDCVPDLTFLLDMDAAKAFERARRRPRPVGVQDRMEQEPLSFYEAVRAGYLRIAQDNPDRIQIINADQPAEQVQAEIWKILEEKFHGICI